MLQYTTNLANHSTILTAVGHVELHNSHTCTLAEAYFAATMARMTAFEALARILHSAPKIVFSSVMASKPCQSTAHIMPQNLYAFYCFHVTAVHQRKLPAFENIKTEPANIKIIYE